MSLGMDPMEITPAHVAIHKLGKEAVYREGQQKLAAEVAQKLSDPGSDPLLYEAPVGVGKSFAYLVPAVARAIASHGGYRTLVSVPGLSLQEQLVEKDIPAVIEAFEEFCGVKVRHAKLMGWTNYVCACAALASARQHLKAKKASQDEAISKLESKLKRALQEEMLLWALKYPAEEKDEATKDEARKHFGQQGWEKKDIDEYFKRVAAESSAECSGSSCGRKLAQGKADAAHIVVTNHHTLGVRAMTEASIFAANFSAVVIDEAHDLADSVRSKAKVELTQRSIETLCDSFAEAVCEGEKRLDYDRAVDLGKRLGAVKGQAQKVFEEVSKGLRSRGVRPGRQDRVSLDATDADDLRQAVNLEVDALRLALNRVYVSFPKTHNREKWLNLLGVTTPARTDDERRIVRMVKRLNNKVEALDTLLKGISLETRVRSMGWNKNGNPALISEQVGIADKLWERVFHNADSWGEEGASPRSVVMVSGTLSVADAAELSGEWDKWDVDQIDYPYAAAKQSTVLHCPDLRGWCEKRIDESKSSGGQPRLNPADAFAEVAREHAAELIRANNGSAMLICARVDHARAAAQHLRDVLPSDITVFSEQEQGLQAIDEWRKNERSVLVGCKSIATGVDGAGETCSLVIVDRPSRRPPDPLTDARAEALDPNKGPNWLYVSDAATLLRQSAGRLIRGDEDNGMLVVMGSTASGAPLASQSGYYEPLWVGGEYERSIADFEEAKEWLRQRRRMVESRDVDNLAPGPAQAVPSAAGRGVIVAGCRLA